MKLLDQTIFECPHKICAQMYSYVGDWANDVRHGEGEMTLFSGWKYKGSYVNN